jgi:hypothetical protein
MKVFPYGHLAELSDGCPADFQQGLHRTGQGVSPQYCVRQALSYFGRRNTLPGGNKGFIQQLFSSAGWSPLLH